MKRKIYSELLKWKQTWQGKTALMIDGARRIGKSWIAREFAINEYKSHIIIDFNNVRPEILELFEHYLTDLDTFFNRLSLYTGTKLYKRNSLIIFDEVQLYPRARAAIKYFVEDGRYDFIETGSLVSINHNVKDIVIPSEEERIEMFPMDLEEFTWAIESKDLFNYAKECYRDLKPLSQGLHRQMMEILRSYMIVGGMPQSVLAYKEKKDFRESDRQKRIILSLYRNDISKYAGRQAPMVTRIFDSISGNLQLHEKKFRPSLIKSGSKMREYDEALFWLDESRVANFCYGVSEPSVSLGLNRIDNKVKLYMADTGLLLSMAFGVKQMEAEGIYEKLLRGKLEFNKGMLTENLVSQLLRSNGHPLYFFSQYSNTDAADRMEIDFLISKPSITSRHNISLIEVKSSSRYALSSLEKCRKKFKSYIDKSFVFHSSDLKIDNGIIYLPLYMAGLV